MATKKAAKRKAIPAGDRMRFLRRKVADGTATDDEQGELQGILASKPKNMDDLFDDSDANSITGEDNQGTSLPSADDAQSGELTGVQPEPPPIQEAPKPPPVPHRLKLFTGKVPTPGDGPKVQRDQAPGVKPRAGQSKDENWKAPYLDAAKGAGREATVLFCASRWIGALEHLTNSIRSVGVEPMVDINDNSTRAMIVLTVDDLLPANIILKPAHMAAFATTTILGQTFYHRKAIAAKEKASKDATEMKARLTSIKDAQHETVVPSVAKPNVPEVARVASPVSPKTNGVPVVADTKPVSKADSPKYDPDGIL